MSTLGSPQPPRPPLPAGPPVPPRSSNLVAIILLSLALIVVVSAIALWAGVRFLAHHVHVQNSADRKEFSVQTPFGGIQVHKAAEVSEAALGLPIYPGASRVQDNDSASVNIGLPDDQSVRIMAAKFHSPDAIERVKDFYHERLGSEVTKFTERNGEGKTVFEIKRSDLEKIVTLQSDGAGTRIELVRVAHGRSESN